MTLLLKYLDILAAIMVGALHTYNDVAEVCEIKAEDETITESWPEFEVRLRLLKYFSTTSLRLEVNRPQWCA